MSLSETGWYFFILRTGAITNDIVQQIETILSRNHNTTNTIANLQ